LCFAGSKSQATNIDWLKEQILAGEDEAESATALLVLERTARFRESLGDALTDGVRDNFIVGCSQDLPLSASKIANGQRVTQRGIRQVQSYLLRQRWNAGASANEAALVHVMRSMDWCVLVNVVPTTRELRVPDRAFRAALRAQLGIPDVAENFGCRCNKVVSGENTRQHIFGCAFANVKQNVHAAMRHTIVECAKSLGLEPDVREPRDQTHSNNSKGGPDISMNQTEGTRMYVDEVPAATGWCLSKLVVDVTSPSATTAINLQTAMEGPPGAVATAHELDKFTRTIDANVAAVNGFEYMPVAIEKDSLTLGPKMGTLIKRMSRNREGESFDKELERLYGFRDGTWSAPVADRYWRARLVISVVKARERAVDNFIQGTKAWGDNLL